MRRKHNHLLAKHNRIRLKTELAIIETSIPRNLNDIANCLKSMGYGTMGRYPAASVGFLNASKEIQKAMDSIELAEVCTRRP